ncbi:hypothetical protein DH2020_010976 [Rehmannia glutinosa]|uniref:Uncharacterized protein n=1 Tax=Rehmannia glutinosa TaxID=99300 RepID=A0ABR0XC24_REHGL
MPPERVEDQPVINPVTDVPGEKTSNAPAPKKRKETRATHGEKLRRHVESEGKISLTFRKIDGRPVGSHRAEFATEVGVAVKKFAPLQMLGWRHIFEEQKQPIYDRLSEMSDVDLGTGPESFRKETNKMMNARYRDLRTRMHDYYKKFAHLPWDDRVKQMPEKLCDSQEDWEYLCRLFETDQFKPNKCGFFKWCSPPICDRSKVIVADLYESLKTYKVELAAGKVREKRLLRLCLVSWIILLATIFSAYVHHKVVCA